MEYYSAIKKNEIVPFAAMDGPRDYILSEATQTNVAYYLYAESTKKKKIPMNLFTKHRHRKQVCG